MKQRAFGHSKKNVSVIGLGTWQLGNDKDWDAMSEKESISIVHKALDLGCNFFDTAPNYGLGRSEEILGEALKGKREQVVISSKFGHHENGVLDFSATKIEDSINKSLKRLQTDYLDSVLLHNPPFEILNGNSPHFEVFEKLKKQGKILAYGASVDSSQEMAEILETTDSQVIEVMFNILYQEPKKQFQAAKEKNVSLIIKVPLDSGWLSGKYDENSSFTDIRSRWTPNVIKRRTKMLEEIKKAVNQKQSLTHHALQFILAHPEVTTVIPGAKSIKQLKDNLAASEETMDSSIVERLQDIWERHLMKDRLPW